MRILELVGIPAAGKSTLQRALIDSDKSLFTEGLRAPPDFRNHKYDAFRLEICVTYCRSDVDRDRRVKEPDITMRRIAAAEYYGVEPDARWAVYHEHLLQSGLSLAQAFPDDRDVTACYFKTVPLPDAVVAVNISAKVAAARCAQRETGWRAKDNKVVARAYKQAIGILVKRGVPIVKVRGDGDVAAQVATVRQELQL